MKCNFQSRNEISKLVDDIYVTRLTSDRNLKWIKRKCVRFRAPSVSNAECYASEGRPQPLWPVRRGENQTECAWHDKKWTTLIKNQSIVLWSWLLQSQFFDAERKVFFLRQLERQTTQRLRRVLRSRDSPLRSHDGKSAPASSWDLRTICQMRSNKTQT